MNDDRCTKARDVIMRYLKSDTTFSVYLHYTESFNIINYTDYFFLVESVFSHPSNYKSYLCADISSL